SSRWRVRILRNASTSWRRRCWTRREGSHTIRPNPPTHGIRLSPLSSTGFPTRRRVKTFWYTAPGATSLLHRPPRPLRVSPRNRTLTWRDRRTHHHFTQVRLSA